MKTCVSPSKVGHFIVIAKTFSTIAKNFQYLVQIFTLLIIIPDAFFDWNFHQNSYLLRPEKLKIENCTLYFKFWVREPNGIGNYLTIQIRIPVGKATLFVYCENKRAANNCKAM